MAYCGPRGIPFGFWDGGRWRWDDFDRAAALAWMEREADRCPGCGLHRSDVPDDERDLPVAPEYVSCAGCRVKELGSKPDKDEARWKHFRWKLRSASRRRR